MRAPIRTRIMVIHNFSHVFCFSLNNRLTPYLQCYKFDQFVNIDTTYAQYRIHSAILRNHLNYVITVLASSKLLTRSLSGASCTA